MNLTLPLNSIPTGSVSSRGCLPLPKIHRNSLSGLLSYESRTVSPSFIWLEAIGSNLLTPSPPPVCPDDGFWDFTADMAHGDTAYTNLALKAHTDSTYFVSACDEDCGLPSTILRLCALSSDGPLRSSNLPPPLTHRRLRRRIPPR